MSIQLFPSGDSTYPLSHKHSYPPSVFTHLPPFPQGLWLALEHSSISIHVICKNHQKLRSTKIESWKYCKMNKIPNHSKLFRTYSILIKLETNFAHTHITSKRIWASPVLTQRATKLQAFMNVFEYNRFFVRLKMIFDVTIWFPPKVGRL